MIRILFDNSIMTATDVFVGRVHHVDTPEKEDVYIQFTQPLSAVTVKHLIETGHTTAEMAEMEDQIYFYNRNDWSSSEEAYADACDRIKNAFETGKLCLDDLINVYDYEVE